MSLTPRAAHALEQLGALLREIGHAVGQYRKGLEDAGVPAAEAAGMAQRMEERITGPILDRIEQRMRSIEDDA